MCCEMRVGPRTGKAESASRRRHLRPEEAAKLIAAAGKRGRYPERDKLLPRLAYRHGLRASEAVGLCWDGFDLDGGTISRAKRGSRCDQTLSARRLAPALRSRIILRTCSISAVRAPCVILAFRIRSSPSNVRGPVDLPPCNRHRPFGMAG
jgi:integrase